MICATGVQGRPRTAGGFHRAVEATFVGKMISRTGEVLIETSNVAGTINSRNSTYTDVFVDGNLVVRNNELGSRACRVAVEGHGRFLDHTDVVQIGSDGPPPAAPPAVFWVVTSPPPTPPASSASTTTLSAIS